MSEMKSLTEALREAYAFDERRARRTRPNQGCDFCWSESSYVLGHEDEAARRKPIDEAVIACVEALEGVVRDGEFAAHAEKRYLEVGRPKQNVEKTGAPMRAAKERADKALAQLRAAVEKGRGDE